MNASEQLEKSNLLVIQTVDDLPEAAWDMPGVCGNWSVKDIVAHLASYEHIVVEVLSIFQKDQPTPSILKFLDQPDQFNAAEVAARKYHTAQHVLDEYQDTQVEATSLLMHIPDEEVQRRGTMPWYGEDACLADFIHRVYEHTQEHCEQIARFRQRL
ncbi:MAG TPA: DinB family protein [Ktedonobacteraceae bacterium]